LGWLRRYRRQNQTGPGAQPSPATTKARSRTVVPTVPCSTCGRAACPEIFAGGVVIIDAPQFTSSPSSRVVVADNCGRPGFQFPSPSFFVSLCLRRPTGRGTRFAERSEASEPRPRHRRGRVVIFSPSGNHPQAVQLLTELVCCAVVVCSTHLKPLRGF